MTVKAMSKTVILIDDDPDDLDIMKEALVELGDNLHYISFIYPEEALRVILNELIVLPQYIFIDINMPRMTGDKCLAEFRKHSQLKDVIITMFSTSMPENVSEALKKKGANFTFQKPSKFDGYESILKEIFYAKVES